MPLISVVGVAVGSMIGLYEKIARFCGKKQNSTSWLERRVQEIELDVMLMTKYCRQKGYQHQKARQYAVREVAAKTISDIKHYDRDAVKKALDAVVAEMQITQDKNTALIIDEIADYAVYPDKYTFRDRLAVGRDGLDLFIGSIGIGVILATVTAQTGSIAKTIAAGFAGTVASFVAGIYVDSTVWSQIFSNRLRQRKEQSRQLYERFETVLHTAD